MNKIWAYVIILVVVIGFIKWYSDKEYDAGKTACVASEEKKKNKAINEARAEEQTKQKEANKNAKKQFDNLEGINAQLISDLDKLRKRSSRTTKTGSTRPECKGANGRSLSAEDAGFLTREAARADKIREGLIGCYNHVDLVIKKSPN